MSKVLLRLDVVSGYHPSSQHEELGSYVELRPVGARRVDFETDFAPLYDEVDDDALFQKALCVANRKNSLAANRAKNISDVLFLRRTSEDIMSLRRAGRYG